MRCTGCGGSSNTRGVSLAVLKWIDTDGDGAHNDHDSDDDGDGMPDTWENANGLDPLADDTAGDPDKDGDNNLTGYDNGTDPQKHEVARLTDFRLAADTIHTNGTAVFHWNSRYATTCRFADDEAEKDLGTAGPLSSEPGDFKAGTWQIAMICEGPGGASPQRTVTLTVLEAPAANADTDGDGMPDLWELGVGLDPADPSDARLDDDNDGHSNLTEYNAGTDPNWGDSHPGSIPAASFGFNELGGQPSRQHSRGFVRFQRQLHSRKRVD